MPWWGILLIALGAATVGLYAGFILIILQFAKGFERFW